jgi:hypothetical protein
MSQLINSSSNLNAQLSGQNHYFVIEKFPEVSYSIIDVGTPDISIGKFGIHTPFYEFKHIGSSLSFSDLRVTFIVDETLSNYRQLYKWMLYTKELQVLPDTQQLSAQQQMEKISALVTSVKSDCELHILTNKKNDQVVFKFIDCFPVSIGGISYSVKAGSDILTCDCSFSFDSFDLTVEPT